MRHRLHTEHAPDRGENVHSLCLLPGWGFDARIFERAPWPCETIPVDHAASLSAILDARGVAKISLLGWSLGALKALAFAREFPHRVERLILVGLRPAFPAEEIQWQRAELAVDLKQGMRRFYRRVFAGQKLAGQKQAGQWFAEHVEPQLLESLDPAALGAGLDDLGQSRVQPEDLHVGAARKVSLLHGGRDLIAPVAEVSALAAASDARLTIFRHAGHAAFLDDDFPDWLARELDPSAP